MLRGIWQDPKRFKKTYWSQIKGYYFTHDRAKRDAAGDFWILGRTDDMLIVAGHNLSNAEIESSLTQHPSVVEAAVVGIPDEVKGQRVIAFVILRKKIAGNDELITALGPMSARRWARSPNPRKFILCRISRKRAAEKSSAGFCGC